jgi:hypothetical protein
MMWVSPPVTQSQAVRSHATIRSSASPSSDSPRAASWFSRRHLRRDVGGPHHHDLVLVGEHLVEAGGLVAVLAHERHALLDDRGEEVEL